jgi:hypothetical protein
MCFLDVGNMSSGYNLRRRLPNPHPSTPPKPITTRPKTKRQELAPHPGISKKRTRPAVTQNEQPRKRTRLSCDAQPKAQKEETGTHRRPQAHRRTEKLKNATKKIHEVTASMKILVAKSAKTARMLCQAVNEQERTRLRANDDTSRSRSYGFITKSICLLVVYSYVAAVTTLSVDLVNDGV